MKTTSNKKYVVLRNGIRVSDVEYDSMDEAVEERDFWNRVVNRWPDGSTIEIVERQNKHRVYNLK